MLYNPIRYFNILIVMAYNKEKLTKRSPEFERTNKQITPQCHIANAHTEKKKKNVLSIGQRRRENCSYCKLVMVISSSTYIRSL